MRKLAGKAYEDSDYMYTVVIAVVH